MCFLVIHHFGSNWNISTSIWHIAMKCFHAFIVPRVMLTIPWLFLTSHLWFWVKHLENYQRIAVTLCTDINVPLRMNVITLLSCTLCLVVISRCCMLVNMVNIMFKTSMLTLLLWVCCHDIPLACLCTRLVVLLIFQVDQLPNAFSFLPVIYSWDVEVL